MHYKKHERCLPLRRAKGTNQRKSWDTFGSSRRNIMVRSCAVTPAVSCQAIACRQVKFRTHAEPMPMAKKQPTWLTVYFVQQQQRCTTHPAVLKTDFRYDCSSDEGGTNTGKGVFRNISSRYFHRSVARRLPFHPSSRKSAMNSVRGACHTLYCCSHTYTASRQGAVFPPVPEGQTPVKPRRSSPAVYRDR